MTDRDKKPIGPNKGYNRTSIGIIILIVSGVVLSLIFDIPLAINTDDENYSLYLLSFISALIGSILFFIAWLWYAVRTRRWLASFGWWLFLIGTSFEMYFISFFTQYHFSVECDYSPNGAYLCEGHPSSLFYIVPAIAMISGLILVYMGKKKKKKQPSSQSDISPR